MKLQVQLHMVLAFSQNEEGLKEKSNVYLGEETDSPGVIHPRRKHDKKIVQHHRLVVKVKLDGLVVQFDVGHLCDDVFEVRLAPGLRGVRHHGQGSVVVLLVLVVQEDQLSPKMGLFSSTKNLLEIRAVLNTKDLKGHRGNNK